MVILLLSRSNCHNISTLLINWFNSKYNLWWQCPLSGRGSDPKVTKVGYWWLQLPCLVAWIFTQTGWLRENWRNQIRKLPLMTTVPVFGRLNFTQTGWLRPGRGKIEETKYGSRLWWLQIPCLVDSSNSRPVKKL